MAQWTDRYENHPVHATIKMSEQLLTECEEKLKNITDINAAESYERLRLIFKTLILRFENTDPLLIPIQVLNSLHQQISPVINEIRNFNNNKNPGHLINASNHSDSVLMMLSNIISPSLPEDIGSIKDSVTSFRRSIGQSVRSIEGERNQLSEKFNTLSKEFQGLTADINAQKGRLDNAIAQFQKQFSEAEDRRRDQFEQAKDKRREDYEKLIGDIDKIYKEVTSRFTDESIKAINKADDAFSTSNNEIKIKTSRLISEIESQKDKAAELVTIITDSGMVDGYQRVACQERTASRIWQGIALLSFFGLIGFAVYAFLVTLSEKVNWATIGTRAFVAITFGILAAYAARQADKHELTERRNRKMELELAAIDPYLASLPLETRHKIKEALASNLFAKNDEVQPISDPKTSGSLADLLRLALETISNLTKKTDK